MSEVIFSSVGLKCGGGAKLTPNLFARDKDFLGRRGLVGFRHMQWTVESALCIKFRAGDKGSCYTAQKLLLCGMAS